jgi:Holliday junction resolvase RusA-like endonuclease
MKLSPTDLANLQAQGAILGPSVGEILSRERKPKVEYRIFIPNWRPNPLNTLMHCHWSQKHRLKKASKEMVEAYYKLSSTPRPLGKRKVSLAIGLTGRQKAGDVDCYQKDMLDALKASGAILDDSQALCEWGGVVYERKAKEPGTTIILEELQ